VAVSKDGLQYRFVIPGTSPYFRWMDWTDQHCRATSRDEAVPLHVEMVASAALVEFDHSDFCEGTRSRSIISVPDQPVTKRAAGVSSGILVHQDYRGVLLRKELPTQMATLSRF